MPQSIQRQPTVGDEVIIVRCDSRPSRCGELAVIIQASADGHEFRLKDADGVEWDSPRGDFILRAGRAG